MSIFTEDKDYIKLSYIVKLLSKKLFLIFTTNLYSFGRDAQKYREFIQKI